MPLEELSLFAHQFANQFRLYLGIWLCEILRLWKNGKKLMLATLFDNMEESCLMSINKSTTVELCYARHVVRLSFHVWSTFMKMQCRIFFHGCKYSAKLLFGAIYMTSSCESLRGHLDDKKRWRNYPQFNFKIQIVSPPLIKVIFALKWSLSHKMWDYLMKSLSVQWWMPLCSRIFWVPLVTVHGDWYWFWPNSPFLLSCGTCSA